MRDYEMDKYRRERAAEDAVRAADEKIQAGIAERVKAGNASFIEELRAFACYKPGMFPYSKGVNGENPDKEDLDHAPFLCESYLYALMGKEEARSVLARFNALCRAVGVEDYHELQREMYAADEAREQEEKVREERRIANTKKYIAEGHTFKRGSKEPCCEACNGYKDDAYPDAPYRCRHWPLAKLAKELKA